jgi:hypothetical protein
VDLSQVSSAFTRGCASGLPGEAYCTQQGDGGRCVPIYSNVGIMITEEELKRLKKYLASVSLVHLQISLVVIEVSSF